MTLTIELSPEQSRRLEEEAARTSQAPAEFVRGLLQEWLAAGEPGGPAAESTEAGEERPIWEVFEEIAASIPDEEVARIPADASANVDHYLYGAPRR